MYTPRRVYPSALLFIILKGRLITRASLYKLVNELNKKKKTTTYLVFILDSDEERNVLIFQLCVCVCFFVYKYIFNC